MRRVLDPLGPPPGPRPPLSPRWARTAFFGAWGVAAVALVVVLVAFPGPWPGPGGPVGTVSYVGRPVPSGTNLSFLFSLNVLLAEVNFTAGTAVTREVVGIFGNWTASAGTYVSTAVNGLSTSCGAPWGCYGAAGPTHGTVALNVTLDPATASASGVRSATIALVFWSLGQDTVTVASPIWAAVPAG